MVTTYRVKTERGPGSETGFAVSGPDAMVLALLAAPLVSADLSTGPVLGQGPCSIFSPTSRTSLAPPRHPAGMQIATPLRALIGVGGSGGKKVYRP